MSDEAAQRAANEALRATLEACQVTEAEERRRLEAEIAETKAELAARQQRARSAVHLAPPYRVSEPRSLESRAHRASALGLKPQPVMVARGISQQEWDTRWSMACRAWDNHQARVQSLGPYSPFAHAWQPWKG